MTDQLDIVIDSAKADQDIDALENSLNRAVDQADLLSKKLKQLKTEGPQKIYVDVEYREDGKLIQSDSNRPKSKHSDFINKSRQTQALPSPESKAVSDSLKSINRELSQQSIALRAIQNAIVAERAVGRSRGGSETEDKVRSGAAAGKEDITQISPEKWLNRIASHTMQMVPIQRDISRKLSEIKILLRTQSGGGGGAVVPPVATGGAGTVGWFAEKEPPKPNGTDASRIAGNQMVDKWQANDRALLMQNLRAAQSETRERALLKERMNRIRAQRDTESTRDPQTNFDTKNMSPAQKQLLEETGIGIFNRRGLKKETWQNVPYVAGVARTDNSPLGNPFKMKNSSQQERDRVISEFKKRLWSKIQSEDKDTMRELNRLADIRNKYGKLALMDFCAPKDCHAEVIARAVDYVDRQRKQAEGQIKRKVSESARATERAVKQQYMSPDETGIFKAESTEAYRKRQIEQNTRRRNLLETQGAATWRDVSPIPMATQDDAKIQPLSYTDRDMSQFRDLSRTYAKNIIGDMSQKDISDRIFGYFTDQAYEETRRKMDPDGKGVGKEAQKKLQRKAGAEAFSRLKAMSEAEQRNLLTNLFEEKGFEKIKRKFQEQQRNTLPQRPPIIANDRGTDFLLNSDLEQSNRYFDMDDRTNPARNIDKAWRDGHIDAARWKELMENRRRRGQPTGWGVMSDELADKIYHKNMIIKDHASSGAVVGETVPQYWKSEQDYFMKQQAQYGTGRLLKNQIDSMTAEGLGGAEPSQMHYQPWTKEWYDKQTGYKKALNQYLKEHGPLPDAGNQEWARIQAEELRKQEETDSAARRLAQKNEANERRRQESTQRHTEDLARKYPAQTAQEYEDRRRLAYANRGQQIVDQRTPFDGPDQQYIAPKQRRAARQEALVRNKQFESWFMPAGTEPSGHIQTHGELNKRFAAAERRKQTELDNIQLREIERRPDGIDRIAQAARTRQTEIDNIQLREIERRPYGTDRISEAANQRQKFIDSLGPKSKDIDRQAEKVRRWNQAIDSMQDGSKTPAPSVTRRFDKMPVRAEDVLSSAQLAERDRITDSHGKIFEKSFSDKDLINADKNYIRSSENLLAAEQSLAKSKQELNQYRKDGLSLIEREIKKQNEAGRLMLPHEQERFRKQQTQNLEDSIHKEIQKNKELEDSRNRLASSYQNDAEKMKRAIAQRHSSLKSLEKIESDYRKKADAGMLTKGEEDLYRNQIKPRMAQERKDLSYFKNQLSEHRRYQDMIQKTGMSLRDLKTIEESYGKTLKKTTQGYREAGEVLRKQGILGYGSEKRVHNLPRLQTGGVIGTGRGGGGGGWDSDRLTQVPQNPLMGRMAQFGMMASGMAATMFLVQMIGTQIANLINVIKTFEDSIESITESVKMTDEEIKELPTVIRHYANQVGISTAEFATATEVSLKTGLSGNREEIAELYGLQRSQNIGDYSEATILTQLSKSSDFFADIRKEYMQPWYRYSGRDSEGQFQIDTQTGKKQLGSFGYEWERLLGAGKESVLEVFFKDGTEYGERLKRTMADLTEWINTNQVTFGQWADNVGSKINVIVKAFQLMGKELLIIGAAWASWQIGALAVGGIKMLSTAVMKAIAQLKLLKVAFVESAAASVGLDMGMAGVAKTGAGLGAVFKGLGAIIKSALLPALGIIAALKATMYVWDKYQQYKKEKELTQTNDAIDLTGKTFTEAAKYLPNLNKEIEAKEKAILDARARIEKISTQNDGTDLWGAASIQNELAGNRVTKGLEKEIKENQEILELRKKQRKEIRETEETEAFGRSFEGIYQLKEILTVLQDINKELGLMPDELKFYERTKIQIDRKKISDIAGQDTADALIRYRLFQQEIASDPDAAREFDLALASASAQKASGFNQSDRKRFELEYAVKSLTEKRSQLLSGKGVNSIAADRELDAINGTLNILQRGIDNFSTKSFTEEMVKMTKSVSDVERELMKLNMSDMEKKMFDLQMTYPGQDIGRLAAAEMTMFTHKISEDFMKAQGEDPDLERQIRDIQNFFSGTDDEKSRIIGHMEWQRFDKKLQNRLSEIKDIDTEFGYAPAINLEWKIEDENLKNRFENLKKISEEEYQWLKKRNDQLKDFKLTNIDINKNLFIEEYRSQDAGYMTNREADLRVQQQYMSMLLKIAEATKGLSDTEKNAIQTMIKQRIEREQNTKQLESVVSAYANANNILGQLSDPDSDIAKEKLSEIKTDGLIKLFPNIDPELARKKVRESLGLDWSAEKEFSEISKIGGQLPTLSKKHGEIVYLSNLGLINERYKENIKIAEEAKKRVGEFYSEELKEMSKLIKAEEEYQLKLRMRKHLSKEEDIRVGFEEGFRAIREQSMTTGEMIGTSISSGFDHAANAMGDFVTGTKSASEAFRGMAVSIISDLTRMMIKQQMMNLLVGQGYASGETSAAGGLLGAIGSGIMDIFGVGVGSPTMNLGGVNLGTAIRMADGGVFSNISGHSNSIVNRTTPFEYSGLHKFATGAGIMGEAGPEAIVPLTRMPSGNLGVEAKTTAPKIKINITNNNVSNDVTASQDESPKWNGEEWVIGVVLEHAANNKKNFRTSMKGMLNR